MRLGPYLSVFIFTVIILLYTQATIATSTRRITNRAIPDTTPAPAAAEMLLEEDESSTAREEGFITRTYESSVFARSQGPFYMRILTVERTLTSQQLP